MISLGSILHYLAIFCGVAFGSIGVVMGQASALGGFLQGMDRQPSADNQLFKVLLYGLFFVEIPFVLCFLVAIMLFFKSSGEVSLHQGICELGIGLGMMISAVIVGSAVGKAVNSALGSIARLPNHVGALRALLLTSLTLIETPVLLSLAVSMLIMGQFDVDMTLNESFKLFSAAITMGLGSVAPSLAQKQFVPGAFAGVVFRMKNYTKMLRFFVITEALIETSVILSFVISILLVIRRVDPSFDTIFSKYVFLAIAVCISVGSFGSVLGVGNVGSSAIIYGAKSGDENNDVFKISSMSQFFIETNGFFAFVISLILLFTVTA